MSDYVNKIIKEVKTKNKGEKEFIQSVEEVLLSLEDIIENNHIYEENAILERLVEPDRIIQFRVTWKDDSNKIQVNKGYRVQFNNAIGPYKGGLRFHPSVNLSVLKFLAFEQTFKNSLTGLPIGGAKGGSDFDPRGKSDNEIMNFCQAYMTELYRYIGPSIDIPAGDIGVSSKEIGYMFGQYKKITNSFDSGILTGKSLSYGGSLIRPEATGYGVIYFLEEMMKENKEKIKGKTFVISGYGNVAWGTIKKINELGGKVLTISGHNGYVYDEKGINTKEKIDYLLEMRKSNNRNVKMYAEKFNCKFYENKKPWCVKADVYIPCATQNEIDLEDAKQIVKNKGKYYVEGANKPATKEAIEYMQKKSIFVAPSKASNAGGVAVSVLEMSQNAMRYSWSEEEVDEKLKEIMKQIYDSIKKVSKDYNQKNNMVRGANVAGFIRLANAMIEEGIN